MQSSFNSPQKFVLYTRASCHLCEIALQELHEHGVEPTIIDIDGDPALRNRFTDCVPVIEIDGQVRFRGRIDPVLLRRLLGQS
jgi:glutaredoxin